MPKTAKNSLDLQSAYNTLNLAKKTILTILQQFISLWLLLLLLYKLKEYRTQVVLSLSYDKKNNSPRVMLKRIAFCCKQLCNNYGKKLDTAWRKSKGGHTRTDIITAIIPESISQVDNNVFLNKRKLNAPLDSGSSESFIETMDYQTYRKSWRIRKPPSTFDL